MKNDSILILGAGAAGLVAARELSKAGKKVVILEARERAGGRIYPLSKEEFGYPAEGGAEFVHGEARITKELIKEAGLTFVPMEGEMWDFIDDKLVRETEFVEHKEIAYEKLNDLKEDMPIAEFFNKYLYEEKYAGFRKAVFKMVEGYDAADPEKISTFSLREEWLGPEEWQQGIIKEGYSALLSFLESECQKNGVEIIFNKEAREVNNLAEGVIVKCIDGTEYIAGKVVITLSLPVLKTLKFNPSIEEKLAYVEKIGFGQVIKILLRFSGKWWASARREDLSKLKFMRSDELVAVWWTQYPEDYPVLTGWCAGPKAEKLKNLSDKEILDAAFMSLSNIFGVNKDELKEKLVHARIFNWPADPFSRGAYSYSIVGSEEAYAELSKPINNKIFFAGEALCIEKYSATVEGALASGKETAKRILNI